MDINALTTHLLHHLQCEEFNTIDSAMNGLQVARQKTDVKRVACAVDTSEESIRRAAEWGADMLFVHHGIFWGRPIALTRSHYNRVRALFEHDIALLAVHLPLDRHATLGNNIGMVQKLNLTEVQPFGNYHGKDIGYRGTCPHEMTVDEIAETIFGSVSNTLRILYCGREHIRTVGIISGGAIHQISQAVDAGLDLYITGDASHTIYNYALEEHINVIFGGHYLTETWGVQRVATYLHEDLNLESTFIDLPTAL